MGTKNEVNQSEKNNKVKHICIDDLMSKIIDHHDHVDCLIKNRHRLRKNFICKNNEDKAFMCERYLDRCKRLTDEFSHIVVEI